MKLSIITINRNNAAGLRKTIESVVRQTYTDFEYIIIDGASTDDSVDVIKEYAYKIDYWVSEPDKGIYNAMNKGILKANGEYLLFLNSGDWLVESDVLEKVQVKSQHKDILFGRKIVHITDDNMFFHGPTTINFSAFYLIDYSLPHPASFIRKDLFGKYGLYDESYRIVSDMKFFFKLIVMNNCSLQYLDIVVAVFDGNGISMSSGELLAEEREKVLLEFLPERCLLDYRMMKTLKWENEQFKSKHKELRIARALNKFWLTRKLQSLVYRIIIYRDGTRRI